MEAPIEPKEEDCCNSGCNPCIFNIYERQLKLYKLGKELSEESRENAISQLKYTTFVIVNIKVLCDSLKILSFKRCNEINNTKVWWRPGDHFLYKYINDNFACTRAYTPINLDSNKNENYDFSIAVKIYDNGLVSKHLFELKEGESTLWRGPYGSYKMEPNKFQRIIMIAQGTGIAPFLTIIKNILNNEDDLTKVFLCYCCPSMAEIIFRDELQFYRLYWNFSYKVFLPLIPSNIAIRYEEPIVTRRFSYEDLYQLRPYSNDQILICGSLKFMKVYKDFLRDKVDVVENVILF